MNEEYSPHPKKKNFTNNAYMVRLRNILWIIWIGKTPTCWCWIATSISIFTSVIFLLLSFPWKIDDQQFVEHDAHLFYKLANATERFQLFKDSVRNVYLHSRFSQHKSSPWVLRNNWTLRILQHSFDHERWNNSWMGVTAELVSFDADLICLQNLSPRVFSRLYDVFAKYGYEGQLLPGGSINIAESRSGLASFWKTSKFRLLDRQVIAQSLFASPTSKTPTQQDSTLLLLLNLQGEGTLSNLWLANTAMSAKVHNSRRVLALLEELKSRTINTNAVIVSGEFHIDCHSKEYLLLLNPLASSSSSNIKADDEASVPNLESAYNTVVGAELACLHNRSHRFLKNSEVPEPNIAPKDVQDVVLYSAGPIQPVSVLMYDQIDSTNPYEKWRSSAVVDFFLSLGNKSTNLLDRRRFLRKRRRRNPISDGFTAEDIAHPLNSESVRKSHITRSEHLIHKLSKVDAIFLCVQGTLVHENSELALSTCLGRKFSDDKEHRTDLRTSLQNLRPSRKDMRQCIADHPFHFIEGVEEFTQKVHNMRMRIFLISDGLREMIQPAATKIGVPLNDVFAHTLEFDQRGEYSSLHSDVDEYGDRATLISRVKARNRLRTAAVVCNRQEPGWAAAGVNVSGFTDDVFVMLEPSLPSVVDSPLGADLHITHFNALLKAMHLRPYSVMNL